MFLLECKSRVADSINIIIEYNIFIFSNMFLSVSNEMNNLNYTGISTSPELQGRQLLTTTAAGMSNVIQEPLIHVQRMHNDKMLMLQLHLVILNQF